MRLDVHLKKLSDLTELNTFLETHQFSQINITEKQPQDWLVPELHTITQPVCLHISAKHHPNSRTIDYIEWAIKQGVTSFLIVSGIPRPHHDSIVLLQTIAPFNVPVKFSVVYTPFARDQAAEQSRLLQKIQTGLVSEIYLQIGDNLEKTQCEIAWLRSQTTAKLIGSILVPTPLIRSKFAHTHWQGIELSDQYLQQQSFAEKRTRELFELYQSIADDILVEMFPFSPSAYQTYAEPLLHA